MEIERGKKKNKNQGEHFDNRDHIIATGPNKKNINLDKNQMIESLLFENIIASILMTKIKHL